MPSWSQMHRVFALRRITEAAVVCPANSGRMAIVAIRPLQTATEESNS